MKKALGFLCGLCFGFCLVMLVLHRNVILAKIRGEELPKTPMGCPAYKGE